MGKKKLVTLAFAGHPDSAMTFEVEDIKLPKTRKKFRKKEFNVAAISINARKMAYRLCLTDDSDYYKDLRKIVERPRETRKKRTYISE